MPFDAFDFLEYARSRWRFIAVACAVAVVLALGGALLLPRRYTAVTTILIQPPAGNDPRAATAVSPVYLESLRTYERLAASDSLFEDAAKRVGLLERHPGVSPESLRKRVLEVTKPRDTKILEIRATLSDPAQAQALAERIANETVELSRALDRHAEEAGTTDTRRLVAAAQAKVATAEKAWADAATQAPIAALESGIESMVELQGRIDRDLMESNADLADLTAQGESANGQLRALRARIAALQRERGQLAAKLDNQQRLLESRLAERARLEAERKTARAQLDLLSTRLDEMQSSVSLHGERLEIIDPGVVPGRPSFPNAPLMLIAAPLIAFAFAFGWLALSFGVSRRRRFSEERVYRAQYQA